MQSDGWAENREGSSSVPTLADRLIQDEYFAGHEDERADSETGRWLAHPRRWLNPLFGRFGSKARRHSAFEADPLLEFAPEAPIDGDRLEPKAPTAAPGTRSARSWALPVLGIVVVVTGVGAIAANQAGLIGIPGFAVKDGRVSIETRPSGARVLIDGQPRGITPLVLAMKPGAHTMTVRSDLDERVVPLSVAAGAEVTQYFEMKAAQAPIMVGRLSVVSDPAGAQVKIDGHLVGTSPVTALELTAAQHNVTVTSELGSAERIVTVEPGAATSLVFSLPKVRAPLAAGWLSLSAPFDVQILEGTDVIGFGGAAKMMLTAGRHDLLLVNRSLEYQETRKIDIDPAKVTTVRVDPPWATLSANARPWADMFVDGKSVGQTPIGHLAVLIGTHEVVFRHPQLGERRENVVIKTKGPNRISVDLTK
jgi:hypothetical protein